MLTKVFEDGQIVIPAEVREALGIQAGDEVELRIDREHNSIEMHKAERHKSQELAGTFAEYGRAKPFPTRQQMDKALAEGLGDE